MKTTVFRNARILDPASGRDETGDLAVVGGRIAESAEAAGSLGHAEVIDATGLAVCPGFVDVHVHFREPGQSAKEGIASGARAAAAGGFTTVVCMPNTSPAVDNASVVAWIREKAEREAIVNVEVAGAITKGIAGEELAPAGSLKKAGVVALTDDGRCVQNHELMRRAVEYARMFDLPVFDHCQDYNLAGKGVMHEGKWSLALGLPGWPSIAEETIVARNALLAELCESPIHLQHLSAAGSVRILREARSRGVKLTGEVCPHHIALTDADLAGFDTNFKMNPPLREPRDVEALLEGLADGTITVLATDHAPHCDFEKEVEFDQAPFGIVGLETAFGLFATRLVHESRALDLPGLIRLLTVNPARLIGSDRGTLRVGAPADIALVDPSAEWMVDKHAFLSRARNTPFHGRPLKGRVVRTLVGGETVFSL